MKKKNNKGFIAISLIYSFFLVFLMTLLTIVSDYAYNRILLNNIKKTTQEKLNNLSEFNPIWLENREYWIDEAVTYAEENWKVIVDQGASVLLRLDRSLTNEELKSGLDSTYQNEVINGNSVHMCYDGYDPIFCFFKENNVGGYSLYSWEDSFAKRIVEKWLNDKPILQKAKARNALEEMTFYDGRNDEYGLNIEYHGYVRIPMSGENFDGNIWTLSYAGESNNQSLLYVTSGVAVAHSDYKEVRPVISVKKESIEING